MEWEQYGWYCVIESNSIVAAGAVVTQNRLGQDQSGLVFLPEK
jgi:carbonic anhydrase/acetyltransferase-like protein (isoleucine patch superfamily)